MTAVDERPVAHVAAGVYPNMDEAEYHRSLALSASGAKRLLPPGAPALFKHDRDNGGRPNTRAFDFGHAAHAAVLGIGADVVVVQKVSKDKTVVDADDYTTKSAQEHRDAIYAAGQIPILAKEKAVVDAMAAALLQNPLAAKMFEPGSGQAEVSVFWHDEKRGVDRRARFDWLPHSDGDYLVVPDYKTTVSAEPHAFSRSIFTYGYDIQAVYYADAVLAAGLAKDVTLRFVAQEKTAPYLVTVHELDSVSLALGRARVDEACEVFRTCTETNTWPGYSDDVEVVGPPTWLAAQYGLEDLMVI